MTTARSERALEGWGGGGVTTAQCDGVENGVQGETEATCVVTLALV